MDAQSKIPVQVIYLEKKKKDRKRKEMEKQGMKETKQNLQSNSCTQCASA